MLFDALAPSSALQLIGFADVDAFRPIESMEDARSIPLDVRNFAAARAVVSLPGCRIVMMRSFARILDGAYRMPGGMVILPMTDDLQVNSKGMDLDARFFIALRGSDECHFVERRTNHHAMIIFSPGLSDRGWFDQADDLRTYGANRPALLHARQLLLDILRTASVQPALFETTEVAAHLQEGLLLALDDLFRIDSLSDRSASVQGERSIKLVQRIDDYVAAHPTAPIYTAELAGEFGVSIRTLGGAVSKVRGMSLHQYIRLKKLWATRSRLLKGGGATVTTCARAQGFHHLGEFSAAYRATFHEAPSDTLARGRQAGPTAR
ncbi:MULTISPECIES: AraC family transcriptional regulator [unclassified Bradyrhizobium]|uniref:AraC family transcriptional regulator n=1 Tax=unclassified Bradyrhizobium TaxID=2631580 RepID=UPI001FFC27D0|nr:MULTISPECIES: AraC family transcriptional regulator [unclassified Bradyrhizobium]MCK1306074.1 AraC family transcriptional regulator [Bradyrhizobium sp. 45]MCK1322365.1 AraC family transcriptional regulator [Bradyrhizobium sp. 156]MCK1453402.1 AraC family transcriptional regulator [Bradyrhizobium sp. 35]MCK1497027.1 AraC family transcriptional regulator [Bradyrhizobium sp. 188]MCK1532983.1 AraC family transcriptional regulator [Bradyrhizobium sp. 176]